MWNIVKCKQWWNWSKHDSFVELDLRNWPMDSVKRDPEKLPLPQRFTAQHFVVCPQDMSPPRNFSLSAELWRFWAQRRLVHGKHQGLEEIHLRYKMLVSFGKSCNILGICPPSVPNSSCSILVLIVIAIIIVIFELTQIGWWEAMFAVCTCWRSVVDKMFFGPRQNFDGFHPNSYCTTPKSRTSFSAKVRVWTYYFPGIWSEISCRLHKRFIIDTCVLWIIYSYLLNAGVGSFQLGFDSCKAVYLGLALHSQGSWSSFPAFFGQLFQHQA